MAFRSVVRCLTIHFLLQVWSPDMQEESSRGGEQSNTSVVSLNGKSKIQTHKSKELQLSKQVILLRRCTLVVDVYNVILCSHSPALLVFLLWYISATTFNTFLQPLNWQTVLVSSWWHKPCAIVRGRKQSAEQGCSELLLKPILL